MNRHAENIAKTGLSVMGVMGGQNTASFGYTIGLTETYRHPEFLMFGLPVGYFAIMLNSLADKIKAGQRFKDGDVVDDIANMPCIIKDITLDAAGNYAFQTFRHYEGTNHQPRFQMVVLPDAAGLFPWDEGYAEKMRKIQPELWTA